MGLIYENGTRIFLLNYDVEELALIMHSLKDWMFIIKGDTVMKVVLVISLLVGSLGFSNTNGKPKKDYWCCMNDKQIAKFTKGKLKGKKVCVRAKTRTQKAMSPDKWETKPERINNALRVCTSNEWGAYQR